jgi:hypothetical protein
MKVTIFLNERNLFDVSFDGHKLMECPTFGLALDRARDFHELKIAAHIKDMVRKAIESNGDDDC